MKYIQIFMLTAIPFFACLAQTNSPSVIVSSGTLTAGEDASLSWTIGESLIESYGEEELMLLQGFQEVEDFPVAIEGYSFEDAGVLVYPTCTRTIVNVVFAGPVNEAFTGEITDISGKTVSVVKMQSCYNEINLEAFPYGVYLLTITLGDQPVYETKIIRY
jgi:hypothetical protein